MVKLLYIGEYKSTIVKKIFETGTCFVDNYYFSSNHIGLTL